MKRLKSLTLAGILMFSTGCGTLNYVRKCFDTRPYNVKKVKIPGKIKEITNPKDKWAILMCGHDGKSFVNNVSLAYKSLRELGYKDDHIELLASDGVKIEYNGKNVIDHGLTVSDLGKVFSELRKKIKNTDELFVYYEDHGNRYKGESVIFLNNKRFIKESDFEALFRCVNPQYSITLFASCHSGGFARRLVKEVILVFQHAAGINLVRYIQVLQTSFFTHWLDIMKMGKK